MNSKVRIDGELLMDISSTEPNNYDSFQHPVTELWHSPLKVETGLIKAISYSKQFPKDAELSYKLVAILVNCLLPELKKSNIPVPDGVVRFIDMYKSGVMSNATQVAVSYLDAQDLKRIDTATGPADIFSFFEEMLLSNIAMIDKRWKKELDLLFQCNTEDKGTKSENVQDVQKLYSIHAESMANTFDVICEDVDGILEFIKFLTDSYKHEVFIYNLKTMAKNGRVWHVIGMGNDLEDEALLHIVKNSGKA